MKPRRDPVAAAALVFVAQLPRHKSPPSTLDAVLPETAKSLDEVKPFEQKTPVPRKMRKYHVSSLIERILTKKITFEKAMPLCVASERDYVLSVLDEVYAWAEVQGFEVMP